MKMKMKVMAFMVGLLAFLPVLGETVAKIGETPYETLGAAFAAAKNGDMVELLAASYGENDLTDIGKLHDKNVIVVGLGMDKTELKVVYAKNGSDVNGLHFQDLTLTINHSGYGMPYTQTLCGTYERVKFNGLIAVDHGTSSFTDCVFTGTTTGDEYILWQYGGVMLVERCTFEKSASKGIVKLYCESSYEAQNLVKDCVFLSVTGSKGCAIYASNSNNLETPIYEMNIVGNTIPEGVAEYKASGDGLTVVNPVKDATGKFTSGTFISGNANKETVAGIISGVLAENSAFVPSGDRWSVGVKITEETIVTTKPQESKVEVPTDVVEDTEVAQKIEQSTKVEGVKLTASESAQKPAGIVAVVATAKEQNATFAAAVEAAAEVSVKVEVEVKPTKYDNTADKGEVAFKLTPKATVTVVQNETKLEQVVEVTNDMIDQSEKIAVSIYTGFAPAAITHDDDTGARIETFEGDQIAYNETTGVATVRISHFSTLTSYGDAAAVPPAQEIIALSGSGTSADPFLIACLTDLVTFRDWVNAGHDCAGQYFKVTADIDMASVDSWTPIGTNEHPFSGVFDGNEKTISGLTITGGSSYVGLFGYLGAATVQDLALVGANVTGVKRVGALIGQIKGSATVKNCTLDATSSVTGSDSNTGGLIGEVSGQVTVLLENLENNATVVNTEDETSRAAGIVCQATSGATVTVKNCVNKGPITTNSGYTGGIMSAKQGKASVTFDGCSNTGTLTDGTKGTGDLLAWMCNGGSVTIVNYTGDAPTAIGWVSQDNYTHYVTIGEDECYVRVANSGNGYTFATLYASKENVDKKYLENICAFFTYAKSVNPNFEGYPETPMALMGKAYNSVGNEPVTTLFNSDTASGWPQLLAQYNAAEGKSMTAEDFVVTWGTKDKLYCVKEVAPARTITVTNTAEAQAALDATKKGDTIVFAAGTYDQLFLRQTKANSTREPSLDNGSSYPAYYREFKDITIKAADDAAVTVKGITAEAGLFWCSSAPASNQADMNPTAGFHSYLDIENLAIEGLAFDVSANSAVVLRDNAITGHEGLYVDGLTIDHCSTVNGDETKTGIHFLTAGAGTTDNNFFTTEKKGINNVTVSNCEISHVIQPICFNNETALLNNLTVTGNTFTDCGYSNILQLSNKSNTGTFTITDNTVNHIVARFIRSTNATADWTITGNTLVNPLQYEEESGTDVVKITGVPTTATITSSNNSWGEGSLVNGTWIANGDKANLVAVAEIVVGKVHHVYATLAEAVAAVEDGQTIKLLTDMTEVCKLGMASKTTNPTITFDLNGHTIYNKVQYGTGPSGAKATFIIKNGTIDVRDENLDTCAIHASGSGQTYKSLFILEDLTIYGYCRGKYAITGQIDAAYGDVRILSGNYIIDENAQNGISGWATAYGGSVQIMGGTFSPTYNVEDYLAPGCYIEEDADGNQIVRVDNSVAEIEGGAKFDSLAEAMLAAQDGDTVNLLKDMDGKLDVAFETNTGAITLNLNGHVIAGGVKLYASENALDLSVTIKGGTLGSADDTSNVLYAQKITGVRLEEIVAYGAMVGQTTCPIMIVSGSYHANAAGSPVENYANYSLTFYGGAYDYNPMQDATGGNNALAPFHECNQVEGKWIVSESQYPALAPDGDGVYHIATVENLLSFREMVNSGVENFAGKVVKLDANLDLSSILDWTRIGSKTNPFKGTFDGQNHKISNLTIVNNNDPNGFFGYVTASKPEMIKNLTFENVSITAVGNVGALAGHIYTGYTVSNVNVTGTIQITGSWYLGGIQGGMTYSKYVDCHVDGINKANSFIRSINGPNESAHIGGILGHCGEDAVVVDGCTVENITFYVDGAGVGGIIGLLQYGTDVRNCAVENIDIISGSKENLNAVGYIAGRNVTDSGSKVSTVINSTAADVSAELDEEDYNPPVVGRDGDTNRTLIGTDVEFDENGKVVSGEFEFIGAATMNDIAVSDTAVISDPDPLTGKIIVEKAVAEIFVGEESKGKYETLDAAIKAAAAMDPKEQKDIKLQSCEITENIKLPATLKNVTFYGHRANEEYDGTSVLKDMTINSYDGNAYTYDNVAFIGVVFDNSRIVVTGGRAGTEVNNDWYFARNTFRNLTQDGYSYLHFASLGLGEPAVNFTFEYNTVNGSTFASAAALNISSVSGEVVINGNEVSSLPWRPFNIQIDNNDGVDDVVEITDNKFLSNGKDIQVLTKVADGMDEVSIGINDNIFKDDVSEAMKVTDATQAAAIDLSQNYYGDAVTAIQYNGTSVTIKSDDAADLPHGEEDCFSYYTGLYTEGEYVGEIDPATLVEVKKAAVCKIVETDKEFATLEEAAEAAVAAATVEDPVTITLLADIDLTHYVKKGPVTPGYVFDLDNVTLDLAGHEIKSQNFGVLYQGNNMTIKNGTFTVIDNGSYAIFVGDGRDGVDVFQNVVLEDLVCNGGINVYVSEVVIRGGTVNDTNVTGTNYYAVWGDEGSDVTVESGFFSTSWDDRAVLLACDTGSVKARGGYYNREVIPECVANGYECVANTDPATCGDYPWMVRTDPNVAAVISADGTTTNKFETFKAAVTASKDGETVLVLADTAIGQYVSIEGKCITIDLNGKTLTKEDYGQYSIWVGAAVTVKDSSAAQTGKIDLKQLYAKDGKGYLNYGIILNTNGRLTLESGKICGQYAQFPIYAQGGELIVNGGAIVGEYSGCYALACSKGAKVEINGGLVQSPSSGNGATAIYCYSGAGSHVTVNGGKVKGYHYGIGAFDDNYVTIAGGEVTAEGFAIVNNGSDTTDSYFTISGGVVNGGQMGIYHPGPGVCTISGGKLIGGYTGIEMRAGTLNVTGGEITGNGSPADVEENDNGPTTVGAAVAVAQHTTKLPVSVNISGGQLNALYPLYESNPGGNPADAIAKVSIVVTGGQFKNLYEGTTPIYSVDCSAFASGGVYSGAVDQKYIADGLSCLDNDDQTTLAAGYLYKIGLKAFEQKAEEQQAGIRIEATYKEAAGGEEPEKVAVTVSEAWVKENFKDYDGTEETKPAAEAINAKLDATQENGMKGWQNYVLGVDGSEKANILSPDGGDPEDKENVIVKTFTPVRIPKLDTGLTVSFVLLKGTPTRNAAGEIVSWQWAEVQTLDKPEFPVALMDLEAETYWRIKTVFRANKVVVHGEPAN